MKLRMDEINGKKNSNKTKQNNKQSRKKKNQKQQLKKKQTNKRITWNKWEISENNTHSSFIQLWFDLRD